MVWFKQFDNLILDKPVQLLLNKESIRSNSTNKVSPLVTFSIPIFGIDEKNLG